MDSFARRSLSLILVSFLMVTPSPASALEVLSHAEGWGLRPSALGGSAQRAVNPASVVKIATSVWALAELGPGYRFTTQVSTNASSPLAGVLKGNLYLDGGEDPDFHVENVFLLMRGLQKLGVHKVDGDLVVGPGFWMGWEHGSAGRLKDPGARGAQMAARLAAVIDHRAWTGETRRAWVAFTRRHALEATDIPAIEISGQVVYRVSGGDTERSTLLEHRSRPVVEILRRFNTHSNNDIERFEGKLGAPGAMQRWFEHRWGAELARGLEFETTSGLGRNRMTLQQITFLLKDLGEVLGPSGLGPEAVLPVMNCEPSTLTKLFRRLAKEGTADTLTGKTGTLTTTDGGVSVLAGYLGAGSEAARFVVAVPQCGRALWQARAAIEAEVDEILDGLASQPSQPPCLGPAGTSDAGAEVRIAPLRP